MTRPSSPSAERVFSAHTPWCWHGARCTKDCPPSSRQPRMTGGTRSPSPVCTRTWCPPFAPSSQWLCQVSQSVGSDQQSHMSCACCVAGCAAHPAGAGHLVCRVFAASLQATGVGTPLVRNTTCFESLNHEKGHQHQTLLGKWLCASTSSGRYAFGAGTQTCSGIIASPSLQRICVLGTKCHAQTPLALTAARVAMSPACYMS